MWVGITLGIVSAWVLLSVLLALFLGRMIGIADRKHRDQMWLRRALRAARRSRTRSRVGSRRVSSDRGEVDSESDTDAGSHTG